MIVYCTEGRVILWENSKDAYTINAPCKINLHLKVGEKRPDGFHDLESIFACLGLSDTLRFERTGKEGDCAIKINWEISPEAATAESIPLEKNLVFRAVSLFRENTGFPGGLRIELTKRVPTGAGLGGGSSDAASTLLALNLLAGKVLPVEKLMELAACLGSDVPFFLTGGAAYVSGRGELIESIKPPEGLWVILVKPPFFSDTPSAFRLLDQSRKGNKILNIGDKMTNIGQILSKEALIHALKNDPAAWPYHNDFLSVFLGSNFPEKHENMTRYQGILNDLRAFGASFAGLSGAGSCCFGIFKNKRAAENAKKRLIIQRLTKKSTNGENNFINMTFFLAQNIDPVLE